ncbi:MAG TPA: helix-turn-helix domain-containing protein, partial [Azonexus sp.]|nr:helix-turn-helix domain-containing protein [Azonexus sp.]
ALNVTAVALDYGFSHLGRFSELYKSTFGMLPSEALKERQARS